MKTSAAYKKAVAEILTPQIDFGKLRESYFKSLGIPKHVLTPNNQRHRYTYTRPRKAGFYFCHDSAINAHYAIAWICESIVWDSSKNRNVSLGWKAQLLPGGVHLKLSDMIRGRWRFRGPFTVPSRCLEQ